MSGSAAPARGRPAGEAEAGTGERILLPVAILAVFLGLWQGGAVHAVFGLEAYQLPYPAQILQATAENTSILLRYTWYTLQEALGGFAIGSALGFGVAALGVRFRVLGRSALAVAAAMNAVPIVATAPIFTLWLGFDQPTRIAVAAVATFATMAVSAYKGLTSLDGTLLHLMSTYAASRGQIFRSVRLPSSLPYIFSALKINATLALISALVGEFFGSPKGLGYLISNKVQVADMAIAWSGILAAAVAGILFYSTVGIIERAVIPWHVSFRKSG